MKHRLFSILLVAVTLTTCLFGLGITAMAATTEYGDFLVETTVEEGCSYSDKILTISKGGTYTVSMKEGKNYTSDTITVNAEGVVLRLDNVTIQSYTSKRPAVQLNYDTSLEALGTVSLTGRTDDGIDTAAGISGSGKTLTFLGGTLHTQGGSHGFDNVYRDPGKPGIEANVVMKGGSLFATGGEGGYHYNFEAKRGGAGISGNVTIYAGTLQATGGNSVDNNAGSARGGSGITGSVTVNGGELIAIGGNGGGTSSYNEYHGEGGWGVEGTIHINRGTVTSLGGNHGAGGICYSGDYIKYNRAFNTAPTTETTDRNVKLWVGDSASSSRPATRYINEKYAHYQVKMIYKIQYEEMAGAAYTSYRVDRFIEGESVSIPNARKANHHFMGWQINGEGDPIKDLTLDGSQYSDDVTLTAIWTEKETFVLEAEPQTYTYNGQPQSYVLEEAFADVKVEYQVNGIWTIQAPTGAANYDVRLTRPEDDTYKSFEQVLTAGLVIEKALPQVTAPAAIGNLVFNHQPQVLVTPGATSAGTLEYSIDGESWSTALPAATEPGTYTVYYRVTGDANHLDVAAKTLSVALRDKEIYVLAAEPQTYTYNGQPQSYVLASSVTNVTVEYRVNGTWTTQAPTGAANYDTRLTRPEDDTYKAFETTLVAGLMIHPADPVVTPPTAKTGLVYTGQAKTLVNPGSAQGGTVLYRVNDGAWSEEIPSATEVGTYQIAYQVVGDSNHNNIGDKALPAVEILPSITVCPKDQTCPIHPYADAKPSAWYHDGVHYCIAEGLIKGYDTGLLGPNDVASRGQVVTLLWRAAGSPKPETTDCPFTDVEPSAFYYEAMLWAVEQGITKGTSETTFAPNEICTRSQVVTFLWRAAGSPKPGTEACPFTDVKSDSFYSEAMLWAVEQGITTGTTPTTFQPLKSCTRAEIATFLYRYGG